jgi:lipoate---protein ligase
VGAVRDTGTRSRRGLTHPAPETDAPSWRGGWDVRRRSGTTRELVDSPQDVAGRRVACICRPTDSAVVLGSCQRRGEIDEVAVADRRFSVVKRRSGGGAVVVAPDAQAWVDLFVPSDDPIFDVDVGRAAYWVGDLWAATLLLSGVTASPVVPVRSLQPTRWSRLVCYSGLGAGEVIVAAKKVVGVSQRRDRTGAWFFTMAVVADTQAALVDLLALNDADRRSLAVELGAHAGTVAGPAEHLEAVIVERLGTG